MTKYQVEYNLHLGLGVGSGWAKHDEVFDTQEAAAVFKETLARMDRDAQYRIVIAEED